MLLYATKRNKRKSFFCPIFIYRLDPYGLAGQWLTDALNASVYTYEVAPVFTLMETNVIREICRMIGNEWSDGMFCPGGSTGNGIALNLARYHYYPDVKVSIFQSLFKLDVNFRICTILLI